MWGPSVEVDLVGLLPGCVFASGLAGVPELSIGGLAVRRMTAGGV